MLGKRFHELYGDIPIDATSIIDNNGCDEPSLSPHLKRNRAVDIFDSPTMIMSSGIQNGPTEVCRASPLRPPPLQSPTTTPLRASGTPVSKRGRGEQDSIFGVGESKRNGPSPSTASVVAAAQRKRKDREVDRMQENSSEESDGEQQNSQSIFVSKLPEFKLPRLLSNSGVQEERDEDGRFTLGQVRKIVENAVKTREAELREEYDAILLDRLDEQWRTFAKYNEDNVANKLKGSNYDYYC